MNENKNCLHYHENINGKPYCTALCRSCEGHVPDCYYKQLQKLKTQCESYKDNITLQEESHRKVIKTYEEETKRLWARETDLCNAISTSLLAVPALEKRNKELVDAIEEIQRNSPEWHDCYYKDECGESCTPKREGKVSVCIYELADKALGEES